jgi:large conductance mechanosensitive channel
MLQEFKKFALRGNVIDLAIGVIIGAAFGKIVTSMVDDVIMPPIGVVMSASQASDFQDWAQPLNAKDEAEYKLATSATKAKELNVAAINYGRFINNIVTFLIIAFCIFIVMKQVNRFLPAPAPPPPVTRECPKCCTTISNKATRCPNCTSEIAPAT